MPALLHFAYKYADNPEQALLASANAGGENVARNSLLGALLGAAHGRSKWPESLLNGLHNAKPITEEITAFFQI